MKSRKWQWSKASPYKKRKRKIKIGEGFSGKDIEDNLKNFTASPEHKKLLDRLEETKQRLPWSRSTVDSLRTYIEQHGELTDKQKSFATSLYIDACVTTDDKLFEQVETRKLGYRLMELELGRVTNLVYDIMLRADTRPFSLGQQRALKNIAKRQCVKLTQIPKLNEETFDGWFKIQPEIAVDNPDGM